MGATLLDASMGGMLSVPAGKMRLVSSLISVTKVNKSRE